MSLEQDLPTATDGRALPILPSLLPGPFYHPPVLLAMAPVACERTPDLDFDFPCVTWTTKVEVSLRILSFIFWMWGCSSGVLAALRDFLLTKGWDLWGHLSWSVPGRGPALPRGHCWGAPGSCLLQKGEGRLGGCLS